MSELQSNDTVIDDEQLGDAESILEELDDKYDGDTGAMINVLMVCLAGMMEETSARRVSWGADDGTELVATYSPGRAPEEKLH